MNFKVEIRGILSHEFGNEFFTHFCEIKDVIRELLFSLKGFRERIIQLSKRGCEFSIIKDGDKFIIAPIIYGGGFFSNFLKVVGAIFVVGALAAALLSTTIFGMGAMTLLMIGGAFLLAGTLLTKPKTAPGPESDTSANKTSNYMGLEQGIPSGSPVPLGYGKLLVAGTSIQASLSAIRGNVDVNEYLQESGR